jgi:hypothetical protein
MNKPLPIIFTVLIITTLIIAEPNSVFFAKGNQSMQPNHPITDPIVITVLSPINQSTYTSSSNLTLDFSVTKPSSWFDPNYVMVGIIQEIYYTLDGNRTTVFKPDLSYNWYTDGLPKNSQYSIVLDDLSQGEHSLTVAVNATSYWMKYDSSGSFHDDYEHVSLPAYSLIDFSVASNLPTPTIPELSSITMILLASVILIGVLFFRRRNVYSRNFD